MVLDNFAVTVQVHSHTLVVASTVYGFMGVLVLVYCGVPYSSLQWRTCTSTSEELPSLQGTPINPRIAQELCYDFADVYKLPCRHFLHRTCGDASPRATPLEFSLHFHLDSELWSDLEKQGKWLAYRNWMAVASALQWSNMSLHERIKQSAKAKFDDEVFLLSSGDRWLICKRFGPVVWKPRNDGNYILHWIAIIELFHMLDCGGCVDLQLF